MQVEQCVLVSLCEPSDSMCRGYEQRSPWYHATNNSAFEKRKEAFKNWLSRENERLESFKDDDTLNLDEKPLSKGKSFKEKASNAFKTAERSRSIQIIRNYYRDGLANLKEKRQEHYLSTLNAWEWVDPSLQEETDDKKSSPKKSFKKYYKRSQSQSPSRISSICNEGEKNSCDENSGLPARSSRRYWSLKEGKVYSTLNKRLSRQSSLKESKAEPGSPLKKQNRFSFRGSEDKGLFLSGKRTPLSSSMRINHTDKHEDVTTQLQMQPVEKSVLAADSTYETLKKSPQKKSSPSPPASDTSSVTFDADLSNNNIKKTQMLDNVGNDLRFATAPTIHHNMKSLVITDRRKENNVKILPEMGSPDKGGDPEDPICPDFVGHVPVIAQTRKFVLSSVEGKHSTERTNPTVNHVANKKTERFPLGSLKGISKLSILPSAIFPWRQGKVGSDVEPNENIHDSEAVLLQIKKDEDWDETYRDKCSPAFTEGNLHPRVCVSKDVRREKATSSPAISSSSLSHSEWDIRRPWSEVYAGHDHSSVFSQSVYRLPEATSTPAGGDGPLSFGDEEEENEEGDDAPLSLPYIVPPGNVSQASAEGVFQKFKKSLSLRLVKKTSRSESPEERLVSISPIGQPCYENNQSEVVTLPRRTPSKEEENKATFLFGHPIFRSSKERRRAKLRDVRSAKCNSGDSGDSGIELASGSCPFSNDVTLQNGGSSFFNLTNYDSSVICTTDIGEQNGPITSGLPSHPEEELKYQKIIRRTCSDIGGNLLRQGRTSELSQNYGRQYSSPQPIKMRPSHRLPNYSLASNFGTTSTRFKRNKGSAHLRRSVSQPLDLDKSFENQVPFLNNLLREDEDLGKKQRRPSVGNLLSEENTSEEDAEASDSEDHQRDDKSSLDEENSIVYAEALWDHVSLDSDELVFKAGDLITVVDSSDKDWWWGRISTRIGWFPSVFVRLLVNQEDQKPDSSASENLWTTRRLSLTKVSHDQIRANVINEIISTERDFVKHLRDLVEGYLRQVRKRPDMFSKECIATIFGNIEELYCFQSRFLGELEECIDYDEPFRSCIGECFIRNRSNFEAYSEYCNNHPLAVSKLQELYRQQKFVHFFEACRLLQEMIDISLDGFLLTPVQKICKYPLQLQELLKYTKPSHLDYIMVQGATQAMKEVALLVNERKRRMECLEKIASWQMAVEGWEGPDLFDDSSQLIHQGELIKGIGGPWSKEVTLFLFDHQAVYCKRDLLKRSTHVYRGRINTDLCEVIDIPESKDSQKNGTLLHSWKIHCLDKNKTYVFACKSAQDKEKWLSSFRKERALVACDEEAGFVVSEKQKQVARISAKNHKNRPRKPRSNWFSFGVHKKSKPSVGTIPV